MKINEILNEIGYASDIVSLSNKLDTLGEQIGLADNLPVFLYSDSSADFYIIKNEEGTKALGYIALSGENIHQFENLAKQPGTISALLAFLTQKLKLKLVFAADEPLTLDGLSWLIKTIRAGGRGFSISDQDGQLVDVRKLEIEWREALDNPDQNWHGSTVIIIESLQKIDLRIFKETSGLLKPAMKYRNDERLE